jgi:signal peptidase
MVVDFGRRLVNLALIGLVIAVLGAALAGPIATLTGRTVLVIGGGSMAPDVARGSEVVIERVAARPLQAGEVATFRTVDGVFVTHRVTRVIGRPDGNWFETKGDANANADAALWPETALQGRVVATVPGLGFLSWLLKTPVGLLDAICMAGMLYTAGLLLELEGEPEGHGAAEVRVAAGSAT